MAGINQIKNLKASISIRVPLCYVLSGTRPKKVVINTSCSNTTCCSCVRGYLCLAMPANLKKERLLYFVLVTMTVLPDDVILMARHNGRIDGDTNKYGRTKRA